MNHIKIYILTFISSLALLGCETDMQEVGRFGQADTTGPDVIAYDYETFYTENGKLNARLKTPVLKKYMVDDPYLEFPQGMQLEFYDDKKNVRTSLVADYAIYYDEKEFGRAEGNVVITNADGSVLKTNELYLNQKEEKIYSEQTVQITEKSGYELTGNKGFESNLEFTVYTFWKNVGKIPFEQEFQETQSKRENPE